MPDSLLGMAINLPEWMFRVSDHIFHGFEGFVHNVSLVWRARNAFGPSLIRPNVVPLSSAAALASSIRQKEEKCHSIFRGVGTCD